MKRLVRWLILIAVVALALSVGATAFAAGNSPVGAPYADNASHTIPADTTTWYRFEYPGNHSQITVTLVDAKDKGLAFEVYTPTQMQEWWKNDGVGAGSLKGNDLLWSGNAHEGGAWYVKVMNRSLSPEPFQLNVTGKDVAFSESVPVVSNIVPVTPAIANMDPVQAVPVNSDWQTIPANTTLWYRFPYSGGHDQATLTIPNGNKNFLRAHVHTPQEMASWWNADPVGQATPHDNDLIWSGNSLEGGWWYVEVINDNPTPVTFNMNLEIQDRNLE